MESIDDLSKEELIRIADEPIKKSVFSDYRYSMESDTKAFCKAKQTLESLLSTIRTEIKKMKKYNKGISFFIFKEAIAHAIQECEDYLCKVKSSKERVEAADIERNKEILEKELDTVDPYIKTDNPKRKYVRDPHKFVTLFLFTLKESLEKYLDRQVTPPEILNFVRRLLLLPSMNEKLFGPRIYEELTYITKNPDGANLIRQRIKKYKEKQKPQHNDFL